MDSLERTVLESLNSLTQRQNALEIDLSLLLDCNYNEFDCLSKEECIRKTEEYIRMCSSVSHMDVIFIKRLTKVGYHILLENFRNRSSVSQKFEKFADKLYYFNLEGIAKCQARNENLTGLNYTTLEAHFNSYAGDALKFKANHENLPRNRRLDLETKCYSHNLRCAEMLKYVNPRESAYSYHYAGEAIYTAVKFVSDDDEKKTVECLEEAYRCFKKSAEGLMKFNPKQAAQEFNHAANAADEIFDISKDIIWQKNAYLCNISSASIMMGINDEVYSHRCRCAGRNAMQIGEYYDCSGTEEDALKYLKRARDLFGTFLDFYKDKQELSDKRLMHICEDNLLRIDASSSAISCRISR
jgi:hypothetical protein